MKNFDALQSEKFSKTAAKTAAFIPTYKFKKVLYGKNDNKYLFECMKQNKIISQTTENKISENRFSFF